MTEVVWEDFSLSVNFCKDSGTTQNNQTHHVIVPLWNKIKAVESTSTKHHMNKLSHPLSHL